MKQKLAVTTPFLRAESNRVQYAGNRATSFLDKYFTPHRKQRTPSSFQSQVEIPNASTKSTIQTNSEKLWLSGVDEPNRTNSRRENHQRMAEVNYQNPSTQNILRDSRKFSQTLGRTIGQPVF